MGNIILILCIVIAIQVFFSFLQFQDLKKVIVSLKREQQEGYVMTIGRFKASYSLKKGVVCVLLISDCDRIVDFREMRGRTVFSKLKRKEELIGLTAKEVYELLDKKERCQAFENALGQINKLELIS
jgi:DNA-binding transcriptional regulator of glucitol operon